MKITIVGAGAIGCLLGGLLAKSKQEVFFLDKNSSRAAALNKEGINVEGISGKWQVKAQVNESAKEIGASDLVIICVKSYDTKSAIEKIAPLVGERTKILTLQNGLGNVEIISEAFGEEKVIAGSTSLGATWLKPGYIRHAGLGETTIGLMDGSMPVEMRHIREAFNKAGIETKLCRDIKGLLWSKLIINVGINPLAAITRLPNGKLVQLENTKRIMRAAVIEAVKVAKRKRIKLIYDDPLAKVEAVCETTACNICSMLQDILRHKKTEIDFINGTIVRLGQELGIPVPVNSLLVDLVKAIEAS
ncbi:MAG: 2-dehydropantoate 2-reductase [Candidatus Omnitrophica bacterium]|jgi:2-dehydropantoate 2-reductase|nr:2-dehydropantoate 2-reductase [Candidatus Omnitrophota bacterium]